MCHQRVGWSSLVQLSGCAPPKRPYSGDLSPEWRKLLPRWKWSPCATSHRSHPARISIQITPKRDRQFAGQGDNHDAPDAPLVTLGSVMEPLGQSAIRLMPDPKPYCFDHHHPDQPIADLGDSSVRLFLRDVKTSMAGSLRPSVHTTRRARLRGSTWRYRGG